MEIYVTKDGEQLGPFTRQEAVNQLKEGALGYSDLAWHAEDPNWKPLAEVLLIDASVPSWSEIAASLPEPKRAREKPAPAPVVVKSGSSGTWAYVLALILICGAGLYVYTREAPKAPAPVATPGSTPSMTLSEIFLEEEPGAPAKAPAGEEFAEAEVPASVPEPSEPMPPTASAAAELARLDERSPFDEGSAAAEEMPVEEMESDETKAEIPSEYSARPGLAAAAAESDTLEEAISDEPRTEKASVAPRPTPTPRPAREAAPPPAASPNAPRRHSISLRVQATTAASLGSRNSTYYSTRRTYAREQNITITVRNMSHDPDVTDLEWYFVGKPAQSGSSRRFIYDKGGEKGVAVAAGGWKEIEASAKELEHSTYSGYSSRYSYGDKPDGWIVFAKVDGEVLDVEASSSTLEAIAKNPAELKKLLGDK